MSYLVIVADNFHYMDESENYKLGTFETLEEAIDASKRIVDEYLVSAHQPGMTAPALYQSYLMFGEDPYITSPDIEGVPFSAWDYAKQRCGVLCVNPDTDKGA